MASRHLCAATPAALLAALACGGGGGGEDLEWRGLSIVPGAAARRVEIEPGAVLLDEPCTGTGLVVRAGSGFTCAEVDVAGFDGRLRAIEQAALRLEELEARAAAVADEVAREREAVDALRPVASALATRAGAALAVGPAPHAFAGAACAPAATGTVAAGYRVEDGLIAGSSRFFCPVLGGAARWDTLQALLQDPDGLAARAGVSVTLHALGAGGREGPARVGASSGVATGAQELTDMLFQPFRPTERYYVAEVVLSSRAEGLAPAFAGVRLLRRALARPPELAAGGGRLLVNCGAEAEIRDALGRTWRRNDAYLAPGQGMVARSYYGDPNDLGLLGDQQVPRAMLETAVWCDCDVRFSFGVPSGRYRVVLYFVESCTACVGEPYGGRAPSPSSHRVFDVGIEDEHVSAFDFADAALPPEGDGRGRTNTAVEISREVRVGDGALDVTLFDLGPGNPPENPSINGIAIERLGD